MLHCILVAGLRLGLRIGTGIGIVLGLGLIENSLDRAAYLKPNRFRLRLSVRIMMVLALIEGSRATISKRSWPITIITPVYSSHRWTRTSHLSIPPIHHHTTIVRRYLISRTSLSAVPLELRRLSPYSNQPAPVQRNILMRNIRGMLRSSPIIPCRCYDGQMVVAATITQPKESPRSYDK